MQGVGLYKIGGAGLLGSITMSVLDAYLSIKTELMSAAKADTRIVGLVDYGSSSEGRADKYSDLDLCLFIKDDAFEAFKENWQTWAAQFGDVLLAYISGVGHPWLVYDTQPLPLRVDLNLLPETEVDTMLEWPNSPVSVEAMLLYDGTGGKLEKRVASLLGRSLAPENLQANFEQISGDLWYYLLRCYSKLLRKDNWALRWEFNFIIIGNLAALLRTEADRVERLRSQPATSHLAKDIAAARLAAFNRLVPEKNPEDLKRVLLEAALLSREVCESIHQKHAWPWPSELAKRVIDLLEAA